MAKAKVPLKLRLKVVLNGLRAVFFDPYYILIALVVGFLALGAALWALNADLLKFILFESGVSLDLKIEFFLAVYLALFSELDSLLSLVLVVFAVLFGINIALLVYVLPKRFSQQKKLRQTGGSVFGLVLATIGGGCAACGTSILAPLFATLGITSVAFIRNVGVIAAIAGVMIISYAVYKLAQQAASLKNT
jgi:hypothetical protein